MECEIAIAATTRQVIYYHFDPKKLKEVSDLVDPFLKMWEDRFKRTDTLLENLKTKRKK